MCAKIQWSCAHPRQALSVTSLVYGTCHLPIWSGLPFSSVSPNPLCTGDGVRLHRKALRWLQSNHFPHRFDNNHLDDLPVAWPVEAWTFSFPVILSSSSSRTPNPAYDNAGPTTFKISVLSFPHETDTSCLVAGSGSLESLFIYS